MEGSPEKQKYVVRSLLLISLEHIALNSGSYSERELAALPRRLRINALRMMRIVDLCAFEAAHGVCDDFDATECVWRFVGDREVHLGEPMGITIPLGDLEDMFHSVGDRRLSWNDSEWVREQAKLFGEFSKDRYLNAVASCLFSSQEMLRNAAIRALFTAATSRDSAAGGVGRARLYSEEYLLTVLQDKCRFQPSSVFIDCTDTIYSGLWDRRKASFPIVRGALRGVRQLTVSLTGPSRNTSRITPQNKHDVIQFFRFILEAVFARDRFANLRLTHVTIKGDIGTLCEALDQLCHFLAPRDFTLPVFADSPLTATYGNLEFLAVELDVHGLGSVAKVANRFHWNLGRILENQSKLRKLSLVGWGTCVDIDARGDYKRFAEGIATLFRRPNFRSLIMEMNVYCDEDGYESNFNCVLREFLSSPVAGQTFRAYCIAGIFPVPCSDFCRNRKRGGHVSRRPPMVVADKHLIVIEGDVRVWLDKFASRCLVNHSLYRNLREVGLEGVEGISDDTLVALLPLPLTSVTISSPCTDLMTSVSIEVLVNLLGLPTLEEITLYDVVCGQMLLHYNPSSPDKLAKALMRAVWKQANAGKLVRLDVSRNCLGTVKFQYLRDMFQGLFSFRQLPRTAVFLHDNNFKKEHFQMMRTAWQMNAGNRRMLQLGASSIRRETQTHTQCRKLDDIAYVIT